jgi:hypothetical protein
MNRAHTRSTLSYARLRSHAGSLLISAMLISTAIALGLASYLRVSYNSSKVSDRTYYLNAASNLAEAGLEEGIYCYRLVDGGTVVTTAWRGWTTSSGNATLTLPTFNLGNNAIGIVKIFVIGYDGVSSTPACISQATITPLDGSPVVKKTLKCTLKKTGSYNAAILTRTSLTLGANTLVDSFNSNPSNRSSDDLGWERLTYADYKDKPSSNGNLISTGSKGTITLGSKASVKGNVLLAASSNSISASQVSGSIVNNYTSTPFPSYSTPTFPGMKINWILFKGIPSSLPEDGDDISPDGRYYYIAATQALSKTKIADGKNVTILTLSMKGGLEVGKNSTCIVWSLGNITTSGSDGFTNKNWAGALQIFGILTTTVALGHSGDTAACIYAPLASVTFNGGGTKKEFTGAIIADTFSTSADWSFHYDEALATGSNQVGTGWSLLKWYDLHGTSELTNLATATGGFLK